MATVPYMPLYVADYLADTAHLTTIEHGAYLMLIMSYWQKGSAFTAPDEQTLNVRLANVARMSNGEWSKVRPVMAEFFQVSLEGAAKWYHKRIEEELGKFRAKSLKARDAGLASAQRRLNGRSTDVEQTFNHTDTDTDTDKTLHAAPKNGAQSLRWFEDQFWPSWVKAKNDSKGAALKSFRVKVKTQATLDAVLRGVENQKSARLNQDAQYRAHAATWLNQQRWIDAQEPEIDPEKLDYRNQPWKPDW